MKNDHVSNPRITEREKSGPHLTAHETIGFNGRFATLITNAVGTMWCAYLFALIALISLPAAIHEGTSGFISWVAQTFLQLVLLSVIMVGQKVSARASDKQALQTYRDAEAILKAQDEILERLDVHADVITRIHEQVLKGKK